jgi:LuxR family transcriptional regulator, maltose regulon positive regulatory protein
MSDVSTLWAADTRQYRAPRLRRGTVRRERLLRRLGQSSHVPVTLLVAPAGYGKTTLLVHWLQADPRRLVWLALDPVDDAPERLIASLASALGEPADLTLAELAYVVERREEPIVLVFDDAHHLRSAEALAIVGAIADAVQPGSQLVLAGRCEPALPIGRLRAQGRLIELRARDLVMTRREATKMLSLAELELAPEDVQTLLERTEGWPAGLYIAALSLRGRPDLRRAVERFGGDDRMLADYLRDEVLDGLHPERVRFLERTSVLEELSGPLCDAVLRRTACGLALRDMSRSNLLIVALDQADTSYRYHRLLADMLRAELRRTDPACEAELHRRASDWYARAGDGDRAIEHAIAAGDLGRVGTLLWSTASRVLDGRAADVRRWLERFTSEQIASRPTLALTAAAHHVVAGERDLVEHWAGVANRSLGGDQAALEAAVQAMRATVARKGTAAMGRDAARGYERLPEESPWRSLCCLLEGVSRHFLGDAAAARPRLEEGARRGAIEAPVVQALCLAQLALLAIDAGDWEQAQLLAARGRSQVERLGLDCHPTCALVFAVSAFVRAHRDRINEAQSDRRRATELLTRLVDYAPWYDVETRVVLARTALRLGDVTGTRTLLAEAARELGRDEDLAVPRVWIDELWAQVEAFTVTELVGPSSLTTAELRVLALMPTHLSFREMGRGLHVSANTVKTHAHAVYRKLDVCSRSEAVVRARATGLLDG